MAVAEYGSAIIIGNEARKITGDTGSGFKAGGIAAGIESITGKPPRIVKIGKNRVELRLTKAQQIEMRNWLDSLLFSPPGPPPKVSVDLNPAIIPWALKYAIPTAAGFFFLGYIAHYFLNR